MIYENIGEKRGIYMGADQNANLENPETAEEKVKDPALIIEKQRMILLGLGVLSFILLIGVIVQSLGKSYVMKQLDESNAAVLMAQRESGSVESRTDSLGQLNSALQGDLDSTKEELVKAQNQIEKLQDKIKKLEDANKMLRAKRGLPEEASEDEDLAAEIAAADEAAAAKLAKETGTEMTDPDEQLKEAAAKAEKDAEEDIKSREAYEEQRAAEEEIRKKNAQKLGIPYVPLTDEEYEDYLRQQGGGEEKSPRTTSRIYRFTDKNGDVADFTEEEWNYLLSVWEYTGEAEDMLSAHTVGELRQALGGMR